MATTTTPPQEHAHLTRAEVEALARAKPSSKALIGMIASYVGMGLIVLYCIIPFYWMIVSSLRDPTQGRSTDFIPHPVSIENFKAVFAGQNNFGRSLLNSLIVSGTTTILTLLFGIVAAYALARLTFKGKGAVLWVIMACSMFPLIILIPPLLKMFSSTAPFQWFPRWIDTYQAVIVPGLSFGLPLAVWNLTAFFKQLPVELEQAAMVDGCTPGVAFRKVILPLAAPGVFTTAIIVFIGAWNEYLLALTFL
jgi:multiple sugar transport system permease protein